MMLTGCIKRNRVEFEGDTPGIKNGVFIVKTDGDSSLYGENIKNEKFSMPMRQLKYPGYYYISISDNDTANTPSKFEFYLEDGKYTIETERGKLYKYPKVTSPSKIEGELSAYYRLSDELTDSLLNQSKKLDEDIKSKGNRLSKEAYTALLNNLTATINRLNGVGLIAMNEYIKKYPNSSAAAHLMAKLNIEDEPADYYKLYKMLSPATRNSDDGKELGVKLSHLLQLSQGAVAPEISGKTPGGELFNRNQIKDKVILVEFWRASNEISRQNHTTITDIMAGINGPGKFGVISVSLDTKTDWWTTAIKEDHINWTQVSDLKGDDSPNATNWDITKIPTYYLLNGQWKVIDRDIDINQVNFEVNDYLKHHQ
jgi:hypothetical protein